MTHGLYDQSEQKDFMTQPSLFAETRRVERSPLCSMSTHCGELAEYAEPVETERCLNVTVRCLRCGKTGLVSERKDLR
jgi:hypothetical protein